MFQRHVTSPIFPEIGVMESVAHHRKRIEDVRCPDICGLPANLVHILHRSFVGIVTMRRSIEILDLRKGASLKLAWESRDLLKRLRASGF
jgi:hypothetical protein